MYEYTEKERKWEKVTRMDLKKRKANYLLSKTMHFAFVTSWPVTAQHSDHDKWTKTPTLYTI